MDWKTVGAEVAKFAPMLGKLLPFPGAGIAGELIASALGCGNDPDSISKAIAADPQAGIKLAEVESNNQTALQRQLIEAETNRLVAVNQTMREEGKSEHWMQWSWRPYWGFISGTAFLIVCCFTCYLAYKGIVIGDPNAIPMIPQLIGAFAALFAIPMSILGVASWHRGAAKVELAKRGTA